MILQLLVSSPFYTPPMLSIFFLFFFIYILHRSQIFPFHVIVKLPSRHAFDLHELLALEKQLERVRISFNIALFRASCDSPWNARTIWTSLLFQILERPTFLFPPLRFHRSCYPPWNSIYPASGGLSLRKRNLPLFISNLRYFGCI